MQRIVVHTTPNKNYYADTIMNSFGKNLDAMRDLLGPRKEAQDLLTNVWEAFGPILFSSSPEIETSRYALRVQLLSDGKIGNSIPSVGIKTGTGREVEALVHELLHINLIQLGFPRLCSNTVDGDAYGVAKVIINIADHRLILPKFLQMGFAEELFLTPLPHVEAFAAHVAAFDEGALYDTHQLYYDRVSKYLTAKGIIGGVWGFWKQGNWAEFPLE